MDEIGAGSRSRPVRRRCRRHGFPHPLPAAEAEANCAGASGRRISAVEEAHAAPALRPQL